MPPRVLLVRFSSLGDVILTTPLLRVLRARYPDAHVTYLTRAASAPILERAPPVERIVTLESGAPVGTAFDARVDLHASLRSLALRWRLGGRWGVYRAHPVRRRWMAARHRLAPALAPVAERFIAAARAAGLDVTPDGRPAEVRPTRADRTRVAPWMTDPYVVLCPGAAHASKRWPAERWRALARRLSSRGRVIATGNGSERMALAAGVIDAFGLPLGPAAALLAGARAVVANDSGLMHLAGAVGAPVVALFGPTAPAFGYAPHARSAVVLERTLPCRPCSTHGSARCPKGHHACLSAITAADVDAALRSLVA